MGLVDSSEDEDDKMLATKKFGMRTKKMQGGDIHRKGEREDNLFSGNKKIKSNYVESVEDQCIGLKTKKSDIQITKKSSTNVKKSIQSVKECPSSVCNLPKSQIQDCTDPSLVTVGCRVAIYWDGEDAYFKGTVTKVVLGKKHPFCVTYDFETINDQAVTVRHRDKMTQERIKISELNQYIGAQLKQF